MMIKKRKTTLGFSGVAILLAIALTIHSGVLGIQGEKVRFPSGGVTLAGTLAVPRWESGPFPAVVIVHGSGRVKWSDQKGYARRLVPDGFAVLMVDKRGVGNSGGSFPSIPVSESEETLHELADDVVAAVDFLKTREDIDPSRIGLVGGSQAGWIMPLAATRSEDVGFMVMISGPAVSYGEEGFFSRLTGDDPGLFPGLSDDEIQKRLSAFTGPHGFDPLPVLERLSIPSLWILGGKDRSIPTHRSIQNLKRIAQSHGTKFDIKLFPEGDHSLRHAATGKRLKIWPHIRMWLQEQTVPDPGQPPTPESTM